jgi:hypothetical protein
MRFPPSASGHPNLHKVAAMAITNYSELQAAAANWLNRTDLSGSANRIPEFIDLAEARLNRDLKLRAMESDQGLTTAIGSRFIALPAGYLEPIALFIERFTGREALVFVPSAMETSAAAGEPQCWTIDGSNIAFERAADQVYSMTFKMLTAFALSDANPTNWLLSNYPDLYLAATLAEGFGFLMDDEALKWVARYGQTLSEVNAKEARSRSMAQLKTDIPLPLQRRTFDINRGW